MIKRASLDRFVVFVEFKNGAIDIVVGELIEVVGLDVIDGHGRDTNFRLVATISPYSFGT